MIEWVKLSNGKSGSILTDSPEQRRKVLSDLIAVDWNTLPYPADPVLFRGEKYKDFPSFCFAPELCKGRSSCPRSYACSE